MNAIIQFFSDNFWATAAALATMSTFISGEIISLTKANSIWRQVIAWTVSIALTVGAYFLGTITVAEPVWLTLATTGVIVGLASNGIYDIPAMKALIKKLFGETLIPITFEKKS